jgi:hypothetical protein
MGYASLLTRRKVLASAAPEEPGDPSISISTDYLFTLVVQGATVQRTITLVRTSFNGDVALAASSLPTGVTASFSSPTLAGGTLTSVLTLRAAADAPVVSSDPVTITATGSGVSDDSITLSLTVTDLAHFGTATLPIGVTEYTSSNTLPTGGATYTPADGTALAALLSGGTLAGGDVIMLDASVDYGENHRLWPVAGATNENPVWIVVDDYLTQLPDVDERFTAVHKRATPTFRVATTGATAFTVEPRATGYRFLGIQVDEGSAALMAGVVRVGIANAQDGTYGSGATYREGQTVFASGVDSTVWVSLQSGNTGNALVGGSAWWAVLGDDYQPTGVVFDRSYLAIEGHNHGRYAVYMEGMDCGFLGCTLYAEGGDADGDGDGGKALFSIAAKRLFVDNCDLVAPGINVMTGPGGFHSWYLAQAADWHIRRSRFYKKTSWNSYASGTHDGLGRTVKNSCEFKGMTRALIEDCLVENDWDSGVTQLYTFLFKAVNQYDYYTGATCTDITVRNIRFKDTKGPLGVGGVQGTLTDPVPVRDLSFYHCYSETPCNALPGAGVASAALYATRTMENETLAHLTFVGAGRIHTGADSASGTLPPGKVWTNCVFTTSNLSMSSDSGATQGAAWFTGTGSLASDLHCLLVDDAFLDDGPYTDPPFVRYLTSQKADLFRDYDGGDYRAAVALTNAGYEGRTPGCDIDMVQTRTAGCATGVWS